MFSYISRPALAVDVICYNPNTGKIAVIDRLHPPFGKALPGGFVDYGESVEDAARREMREELNVDLKDLKLLGVYSDPKRDPRQHVVSVAFTAIIDKMPVAGDDAKSVTMESAKFLVQSGLLVFDHAQIVRDAINQWRV